MPELVFDEHAEDYDAWFMQNQVILNSELLLLAHCLGPRPEETLSVGCGSGLFERLLRERHGLEVSHGVDPSKAMTAIARKRGMDVEIGVAEELPYGRDRFDTVYLNGCPSYIADLEQAFREALRVLRPGGRIIVLDVPAESGYALLYRLAAARGSWDDPIFDGVAPQVPYPVELAASANWRTTAHKIELLDRAGFVDSHCSQTLTRHPVYCNDSTEEPSAGHDRGSYVAICAVKPDHVGA
jgi:ubiquinone/menaquinone biosynthesis C-methylase UbiE